MGVTRIWLYLLIWAFQDPAAPAPAPASVVAIAPEVLMEQAQSAFSQGQYAKVAELLEPLIRDGMGEAMLLAADANYALGTPREIRHAITLYERCLYEDTSIPFPDHSYHQLAKIYLEASKNAAERGSQYEADEMASEAQFYLKRLVKRVPNSYYRDSALSQLLTMKLAEDKFDEVKELAASIWNNSVNGKLLTRVEAIVFINQDPFTASLAELEAVYGRHKGFINFHRGLLYAYAQRFQELGNLDRARQLFLLVYNLWPSWGDSASSLRRLADLHRSQQQYLEAAFLYKLILLENPNTPAEAEAWLGLAELMERGMIHELKLDDTLTLTYRDLVDRIRLSSLPDEVRARYHFKLALLQSFSEPEKSLLILRNLLSEYERGPLVGLYRKFYEQMLFATIDRKYAEQKDWDLDRLYRQHYQFLAFTTQTQYPSKIAKAYIRLNLPSSAAQVYENMWNYKSSLRGFDLAFEEPLTDYLFLLNTLRQDSKLKFRLNDYAALYTSKDRFPDRYLYLKTTFEGRTQEPDAFLKYIKSLPSEIRTAYDAKRLRLMILAAQESALQQQALRLEAVKKGDNDAINVALSQERDAWSFTQKLFSEALRWPNLKTELPQLFREASLFQADYFFNLGNYFDAEKIYQEILTNQEQQSSDRDWAYLQLARLHELTGGLKTSLRIYGQVAYAADEESRMLAAYAKQRLAGLASSRKLRQMEEELDVGQL